MKVSLQVRRHTIFLISFHFTNRSDFYVLAAYDSTMKSMVVVATVLSVVPIILSLGMPNWYLGETQNAVDDSAFDDELYDHDSSRNSLLSS